MINSFKKFQALGKIVGIYKKGLPGRFNKSLEDQRHFRFQRLPLSRNRPDVRLYHNRLWPPLLRSRRRVCSKVIYCVNRVKDIVMNEQNDNRTKWLHLRLNPEEYAKLHKQFSKTTCRKLSDYSRKILLGKPITATHRNQSLDDFMAEMMQLRSELNSIGNNFNQAVKKLHSLQQITEFKSWLITYELEKQTLLTRWMKSKIVSIKSLINGCSNQNRIIHPPDIQLQ